MNTMDKTNIGRQDTVIALELTGRELFGKVGGVFIRLCHTEREREFCLMFPPLP